MSFRLWKSWWNKNGTINFINRVTNKYFIWYKMQYLNSAVLMDVISVEFKAQRTPPSPTKSKLFSVLMVWPESSRKLCKIALAYKSSNIVCMSRVNITEGFVTKCLKYYQKLWSINIYPQCMAMAFRKSTVTTYMWPYNRALLPNHLLSANGVKTLCTTSASSQGKPSPEVVVLDCLTEVKLLQENIKYLRGSGHNFYYF